MKTFDCEILDKTISIWQPMSEEKLAHEDARQIIENISGFFSVLAEWQQKAGLSSGESRVNL